MNEREQFNNCYTKTERDGKILRKYWIFTNYNKFHDITFYTLEVSELYPHGNYERVYKFRWIKKLPQAYHIAENYRHYRITEKDKKDFYNTDEMRW